MPKNEAMLSGKAVERKPRGDVGVEMLRGGNLQPSPDCSYLAGAAVRVIGVNDAPAISDSASRMFVCVFRC